MDARSKRRRRSSGHINMEDNSFQPTQLYPDPSVSSQQTSVPVSIPIPSVSSAMESVSETIQKAALDVVAQGPPISDSQDFAKAAQIYDSDTDISNKSDSSDILARSHLTQKDRRASREKSNKSPDPSDISSTLLPEEIEIPELLKWVSDNSAFTVGAPLVDKRDTPMFRLACERPREDSEPSFLSLSLSPSIRQLCNIRTQEAIDKDKVSGSVIGKIAPSSACKVRDRQYLFSDSTLRASALARPMNPPPWMRTVKPLSRSYVTEADLVSLESSTRQKIMIISNVDAYLCAVLQVASQAPGNPYVTRALQAAAHCMSDLCKVTVNSLHQIVMHRRDMALWAKDDNPYNKALSSQQSLLLRNALFFEEDTLFQSADIDSVLEEKRQEQKDRAIGNLASSTVSRPPVSSPPPIVVKKQSVSKQEFQVKKKRKWSQPKSSSTPSKSIKPEKAKQATVSKDSKKHR